MLAHFYLLQRLHTMLTLFHKNPKELHMAKFECHVYTSSLREEYYRIYDLVHGLCCQILTIFTPFKGNYHKEATTNTPCFDGADLSLLSLSKQLSSCGSAPKVSTTATYFTPWQWKLLPWMVRFPTALVLLQGVANCGVAMVTWWCLQFSMVD